MFCKFFIALTIFSIKPCFKKRLHRPQQGQSGFHFLILFSFILNDESEVQVFNILGTVAQIFGAKKDMVSVPYLTVFGFLLYRSWQVFRFYVGGLLSFIMPPIIAGERPRMQFNL